MQTQHNFQLKSLQSDGEFSGYASVFDVIDNHNDIITHGAFKRSLQQPNNIKLLWQHKIDEPIGTINTIREDAHGLYINANLLLEIQRAKEAYALIQSGAINSLSIGFSVSKSKNSESSNLRLIQELNLFEISLVTFPANEHALITQYKNNEMLELLSKLNSAIQTLKTNSIN